MILPRGNLNIHDVRQMIGDIAPPAGRRYIPSAKKPSGSKRFSLS